MTTLAVIGCGPKAAALAAKTRVLADLGWQVPEIVVIEARGPASNWDGSNGYTDGRLVLGTTPLEDIGFPYASVLGSDVDRAMLAYSYMAYRIDRGDYAEWVDRGLVAPTHAMLADYFKWVVSKVDVPVITATATRVRVDGDVWVVEYESADGEGALEADGLVITGPGDPVRFPRHGLGAADEARVFNGQTFWSAAPTFSGMANVRIAVVGGGETSAAITTYLADALADSSYVDIVTRHPMVFTRSENWREVMYFSTAIDWAELSDSEKIEVIRHVDRGTFSVAAKHSLDRAYNIGMQVGSLVRIEADEGGDLRLVLSCHEGTRALRYDYVVEATGFDPVSFVELFDDRTLFQRESLLINQIEGDLSLRGVKPTLHLPGLAAMAQGPGFPNLSCLGLLSDRILGSYVA
jgi:mycobactin lysine-N-oxygenase